MPTKRKNQDTSPWRRLRLARERRAEILADYPRWTAVEEHVTIHGVNLDPQATPPYFGMPRLDATSPPSPFDTADAAITELIKRAMNGGLAGREDLLTAGIRIAAAIELAQTRDPRGWEILASDVERWPINLRAGLHPSKTLELVLAGALPETLVDLPLGEATNKRPARRGRRGKSPDTLANFIIDAEMNELRLEVALGDVRDIRLPDGTVESARACWQVIKKRFLARHNQQPELKATFRAFGEHRVNRKAIRKQDGKTPATEIRTRIIERLEEAFMKMFTSPRL